MKVILGIMYIKDMCSICVARCVLVIIHVHIYAWSVSCSMTIKKEGVNSADNSTQMMHIY
jgi:hypothetical protein